MEGKFKMSQNRSEIDQNQIIENLEKGSNLDKEVANFMKQIKNWK